MRYVVSSVPERVQYIGPIRAQIPHLIVVRDRLRDAMETFRRALSSSEEATVFLEDDILPTSDLPAKVEAAIAEHPDMVINFFSRHKDDAAKGSRPLPGGGYYYSLCFYLPPGYGKQIADYWRRWPGRLDPNSQTATDTMLGAWLKSRGERYWQHVPSLVQHRPIVSAIDKRRSTKRQSATFVP